MNDFCKIEHLCKQCKISCVFSDFPKKIIIDETAETDLAKELKITDVNLKKNNVIFLFPYFI